MMEALVCTMPKLVNEYNGDVLKLTFDNGKDTPSTLIFDRCTEVEFDEDIEENYEKD